MINKSDPTPVIDAIVPPGTDIGTLDMAYNPPAIQQTAPRRRLPDGRSAA